MRFTKYLKQNINGSLTVFVLIFLAFLVTGTYVYTRQAQEGNPEVVGTEPTATPTPTAMEGEWRTYVNEEYGFSFEYPAWLWDENSFSTGFMTTGYSGGLPINDDPQPNGLNKVYIDFNQRGYLDMSLEEWIGYIKNGHDGQFGEQSISEIKSKNVNGINSYEIYYGEKPAFLPLYSLIIPRIDQTYVLEVRIPQENLNNEVVKRFLDSISFGSPNDYPDQGLFSRILKTKDKSDLKWNVDVSESSIRITDISKGERVEIYRLDNFFDDCIPDIYSKIDDVTYSVQDPNFKKCVVQYLEFNNPNFTLEYRKYGNTDFIYLPLYSDSQPHDTGMHQLFTIYNDDLNVYRYILSDDPNNNQNLLMILETIIDVK